MRPIIAVMCLIAAAAILPERADSRAGSDTPQVTVYDANPAHLWNRLHAALLVREDKQGIQYGEDALDPLLWFETEQLLSEPSHSRALRVLDEFLQTHGENLIRDPLKRVILQRDLWAVFDWSVGQSSASKRPIYEKEKRELQLRLAEVLKRLALNSEQIDGIPDNYSEAVASGAFTREYDPAHRQQGFLPPDLFDGRGPWVLLDNNGNSDPFALAHVFGFSGRSSFLVFLRLPGPRKATEAYLQALWNFSEPWVRGGESMTDQAQVNPNLPAFPPGTEVVLVRLMNLFDRHGELVALPMVESVQIRVYREITQTPSHFVSGDMDDMAKNSGQDFFQFTLSRGLLFGNKNGGLRATGRVERGLSTFQQQGDDLIDAISQNPQLRRSWSTELQSCLSCHSGGGLHSLNSLEKLLKPNRSQRIDTGMEPYPARWWVNSGTAYWKRDRYDWGVLNGYWNAAAGAH